MAKALDFVARAASQTARFTRTVRTDIVDPAQDSKEAVAAAAEIVGVSERIDKRLTPQEDAVLRLIGTGAGDKSIGANLHLSERTVQHHVRSIFAKLGVSNRMQAVVWAVRNGLVAI